MTVRMYAAKYVFNAILIYLHFIYIFYLFSFIELLLSAQDRSECICFDNFSSIERSKLYLFLLFDMYLLRIQYMYVLVYTYKYMHKIAA